MWKEEVKGDGLKGWGLRSEFERKEGSEEMDDGCKEERRQVETEGGVERQHKRKRTVRERKKVTGSRQNCSSANSRHIAVWQEIFILKPMQILCCGFLRFLSDDWFTAEILVENPGQTGFELSFKLRIALADCDRGSQIWEMGGYEAGSWLDWQ